MGDLGQEPPTDQRLFFLFFLFCVFKLGGGCQVLDAQKTIQLCWTLLTLGGVHHGCGADRRAGVFNAIDAQLGVVVEDRDG